MTESEIQYLRLCSAFQQTHDNILYDLGTTRRVVT